MATLRISLQRLLARVQHLPKTILVMFFYSLGIDILSCAPVRFQLSGIVLSLTVSLPLNCCADPRRAGEASTLWLRPSR
jgi:hypothetical protein